MKNIQIKEEKLLLVEGKDEVSVFEKLLPTLGINDVQVINCGGKDTFKSNFPSLIKTPNFSDVTAYAIIQDADDSATSSLQSIQYYLRKNNQPVPKQIGEIESNNSVRVGIYLCPGQAREGMLETKFLDTLEGSAICACVEAYIQHLQLACPTPEAGSKGIFGLPNNVAKAKTLATLVATKDPCTSLGLAAQQGYWNFDHPSMQDLGDFLRQLFQADTETPET